MTRRPFRGHLLVLRVPTFCWGGNFVLADGLAWICCWSIQAAGTWTKVGVKNSTRLLDGRPMIAIVGTAATEYSMCNTENQNIARRSYAARRDVCDWIFVSCKPPPFIL